MDYIIPDWPAPSSVKAYTTVRNDQKGITSGQIKHSIKNLLSLPNEPIWLNQIHGNTVLEAIPDNKEKNADASFANQANQVCAVLTADCLPILLCHQNGKEVAAIHAGWRSLAKGIIQKTFEQMKNAPEKFLAWLGPAIGPNYFEVGEDVYEVFIKRNIQDAHAFKGISSSKWLANLYQLAEIQLKQLGVIQIYGGNFCTYTQKGLFFSYRRDKKNVGRMASLIWFD